MRRAAMILGSALLGLVAVGCGSSSHARSAPPAQSASPASSGAGSTAGATSTSTSTSGAGVLSAEAQSAATGDIPDNQVFLTFSNPASGYRISYPEGWVRKGAGPEVTFADKNNIVHIVIANGSAAAPSAMQSELAALQQANPTLKFSPPRPIQLKSGSAVKATYTTESPPNPVTGKRVLLIVDRYELAHSGKRATVDLGTAKGVDNVDAYRMMINSFRWL